MYRVILINMPFANVNVPSLALMQLKARLDDEFQDQVEVKIINLNNDFAQRIGVTIYRYIANELDSLNAGLGDWFFRQVAFPDLADNADRYFRRYFPARSREIDELKSGILAR